jgi:hypothetical protein
MPPEIEPAPYEWRKYFLSSGLYAEHTATLLHHLGRVLTKYFRFARSDPQDSAPPATLILHAWLNEPGWDYWFHHQPFVNLADYESLHTPHPYIDEEHSAEIDRNPVMPYETVILLHFAHLVFDSTTAFDLRRRLRRCIDLDLAHDDAVDFADVMGIYYE